MYAIGKYVRESGDWLCLFLAAIAVSLIANALVLTHFYDDELTVLFLAAVIDVYVLLPAVILVQAASLLLAVGDLFDPKVEKRTQQLVRFCAISVIVLGAAVVSYVLIFLPLGMQLALAVLCPPCAYGAYKRLR